MRLNCNLLLLPITNELATKLQSFICTICLLFLTYSGLFAQTQTIQGIVSDGNGPLPNVTVSVQGESVGTQTNEEGHYTIQAGNNAMLIFSSVGYRTAEVNVNGRTVINLILESSIGALDEVVVVGYGSQKKKDLVGAVSVTQIKDVQNRSIVKVTDLLKGAMPGLNVRAASGGDPKIQDEINIRGFNSINGGSPLVLIDGLPTSLSGINPDDIQSVTVLKDAEASAIYGARGAFGVILVTTKKGSAGKFRLKYSSQFSTSANTSRTDFITNPYDFVNLIDRGMEGLNNTSYVNYNAQDYEILKKVASGEVAPYHELQPDGTYKFYYETDFWDFYFRRWRPAQEHNLSAEGGSEKLNARISARILEKSKIEKQERTPVDKYNLNFDINFKPYSWLTLSGNSRFSKTFISETSGANDGEWSPIGYSSSALRNDFPIFPITIDGYGVDVARNGSGYKGRVGAILSHDSYLHMQDEENVNTLRAQIKPLDRLTFNVDYSYNVSRNSQTLKQVPFEFLKGNRLVLTTGGLNRLDESRSVSIYKAFNAYGSYDLTLRSKHNLGLMIGFNQEESDDDRISASMSDLLSRTVANLNMGTNMYSIGGAADGWSIRGGFGRFRYNYDERYYLEVNSRYDGSSKFPEGDRWGFFPSVGVAWRVIKGDEAWNPLKDAVSSIKIRASYGKLGNQNISSNTFRQLVQLGRSNYWLDKDGIKLFTAFMPGALPAKVGWETVESKNLGIDLGLFDDKLIASLDVYSRKTSDMFVPGEPLPSVFGTSSPRMSYAGMINRGFEVELNYRNSTRLFEKELSFEFGVNVSNFSAKMIRYDNPNGLLSSFIEGRKIGEIWGYHIDGQFQSDKEAADYQESFGSEQNLSKVYVDIFTGVSNSEWRKLRAGDPKIVDINDDGKLDRGSNTLQDHGDLKVIGNAMPKFPFGFHINTSWQGIMLSVIGRGVAHQDWMPTGPTYWGSINRPFLSFYRKDLLNDFWTPENPGKFPQIYRGQMQQEDGYELFVPSDYYLVNVGYLRIANLALGYSLPQHLIKNTFFKEIKIFVSGENMFTWSFGGLTKYLDPEEAGSAIGYSNPSNATKRSDDVRQLYPLEKTYRVGVQIEL